MPNDRWLGWWPLILAMPGPWQKASHPFAVSLNHRLSHSGREPRGHSAANAHAYSTAFAAASPPDFAPGMIRRGG